MKELFTKKLNPTEILLMWIFSLMVGWSVGAVLMARKYQVLLENNCQEVVDAPNH